jgi:hypothetical protein
MINTLFLLLTDRYVSEGLGIAYFYKLFSEIMGYFVFKGE